MIQFFSKVLGNFLDYQTKPTVTSGNFEHTAQSSPHPVGRDSPRVVGTGTPNESMVVINDVPVLFVKEPDRVLHFSPAFGFELRQTKVGVKMLPDLAPHWEPKEEHRCSVTEAVANVMHASCTGSTKPRATPKASTSTSTSTSESKVDRRSDQVDAHPSRPAPEQATGNRSSFAAVEGRLKSLGEERFPNRKPEPGESEFYTSFAIRLHSREEPLQGEGLKDAIATSGCSIGDLISVKRLRKEKVQAFSESGAPRMKNGEPVFHYKWIWKINIIEKGA